MSEKLIKITLHGPYIVSGDVPLKQEEVVVNEKGEAVDWKVNKEYETPQGGYALCRCGHSENKPFCDGAHIKVGFVGDETADKRPFVEQAIKYEGEAIDLLDQKSICAAAGFCKRGEGIWKLVIESDDPQKRELAIYEAQHCPTGRLVIYSKDGVELELPLEKEISVTEDTRKNCKGPLWVKGGITIEGADGEIYEARNRVGLCRCGESQNMPFCDSKHIHCEQMQGLDK